MATSTFTASTPGIYKVNRYPDGEPVGVEYNYKQGMPLNMDQEFAKNILLAAEHNARRKALKSLPKIKKNKEDK